jgi:hypothetical protein
VEDSMKRTTVLADVVDHVERQLGFAPARTVHNSEAVEAKVVAVAMSVDMGPRILCLTDNRIL